MTLVVTLNNIIPKLVPLCISQFKSDTNCLRKLAGYEGFDLGVTLSDNDYVQGLNRDYRGFDEVTDVLAFPYHEIAVENAGLLPDSITLTPEENMLGDIVLGIPYILKQAQKHGTEFYYDLMTHVTHGIFHLVGYDHNTQEQWKRMYSRELETLHKFNALTGYKCVPLLGVGHEVR